MLCDEKVKIYQLSKPIVDLILNPTYKLNNPIYFTEKNNNYQDEQIEILCKNNLQKQNYSQAYVHPIHYYYCIYLMNFPLIYKHSNTFYNHNKSSYMINYYLNKLSYSVVNTYGNYNNYNQYNNQNQYYYFYPISKLQI